jgi:lipopolysaccharide export LptBFGC system permease protein LptF
MPRRLFGYLLKAVLIRAAVALPALSVVYLAFHLGDQGRLLAGSVGWGNVLRAAVLHLPLVAVQLMPAVVLLAVVMTYNSLRQRRELEALVVHGLAPGWHCVPVLVSGALAAVVALGLDEWVVPACEQRADRLYGGGRASPLTGLVRHPPWLRGHGGWFLRLGRAARGGDRRLLALRLDERFRALRRVDARIDPGGRVSGATVTILDGGRFRRRRVGRYELEGGGRALALLAARGATRSPVRAEALGTRELHRRLRLLEAAGQVRRAERMVFHSKLAFPVFNLVVALLACVFTLPVWPARPVRDLALAVFMALGLWVLLALGWVLGRSGVLPVAVGAWAPLALTLAITAMALLRRLHAVR